MKMFFFSFLLNNETYDVNHLKSHFGIFDEGHTMLLVRKSTTIILEQNVLIRLMFVYLIVIMIVNDIYIAVWLTVECLRTV